MRSTCTLCGGPFGSGGRYRGDAGTGIFEICERCGAHIDALYRADPNGKELSDLMDRLRLAAGTPLHSA